MGFGIRWFQAYSTPKMGWQVQVVDGGLSDMYTNSSLLADGMVMLFWTLSPTHLSFAARAEQPSGYGTAEPKDRHQSFR